MDRLDRATLILVRACLNGELRPGSHRNCAVGAIIRATMGREIDWFDLFNRAEEGKPLSVEEVELIDEIEKSTGFSFSEIREIEAAFEGSPTVSGERRLSMSRNESVQERLMRTLEVVRSMEREYSMAFI